jgi:hypothetical protein
VTTLATIDHPTRCKPVKSASFAAFGSAGTTPQRICCVLKDRNGTPRREDAVLRGPPDVRYWVAVFLNVSLHGDPYTLELWSVDPQTHLPDTLLAVSSGIQIQPVFGTTISYPSSGDNVPSQFTAYGTTDRTNINGQMVNGGTSFTGSPYQSQNFWGLVFISVGPDGGGWTLNVNDDASSPAATSNNLTVT